MVNKFWDQQTFRLKLKGYEGNCKWCWKKSDRKLATIFLEYPGRFDFPKLMQEKYDDHVPSRNREKLNFPLRFFRDYKTVEDIQAISKQVNFIKATDDTQNFDYQTGLDLETDCIGSCEPFK